ncbi:MAG: phosphoribosyltransferase family protein [Cyanobacteriota bacterium]|nr:phosphoribosyltransferase family protein [Cyanobacteriota bacterium]
MARFHWQHQPFWSDRTAAGVALARLLEAWRGRHDDTTLIGLPRGGIAVAAAAAQELQLPLASWAVRKLVVPSQSEYAIGALAAGDTVVWNTAALRQFGLSPERQQQCIAAERPELMRRQRLYGDPPAASLRGRQLIVIDDGIATGMTVQAALQALQHTEPQALVLAVPVLDRQVVQTLQPLVDQLITIEVVDDLQAVGAYYDDFSQLTDDAVLALLAHAKANLHR